MKTVTAFWYMSNNFGDNMNFDLLKFLSKKEPVCTHDRSLIHYICCGSILGEANENSIVCGAGAGNYDCVFNENAHVLWVRGKLSRDIVKRDVPVGDPALLLPKIYNPKVKKKHRYGIIPHWQDAKMVFEYGTGFHIINPLLPVEKIVNEILSCEQILSSSLHGLILADAYNIPNKWLHFDGRIDFKFLDYYSTTDCENPARTNKIDFTDCTVKKYIGDLSQMKL